MDIDDAVGGKTQVVPGTHKGGAITVGPGDENFAEQVELSPKKAALYFFMGIHGTAFCR